MPVYKEVTPQEINLKGLLEERRDQRMSSLITEEGSLFYAAFSTWKKAFREKNPSVRELPSKNRKKIYDDYYIPFYYEYIAGDYNCKVVSKKGTKSSLLNLYFSRKSLHSSQFLVRNSQFFSGDQQNKPTNF